MFFLSVEECSKSSKCGRVARLDEGSTEDGCTKHTEGRQRSREDVSGRLAMSRWLERDKSGAVGSLIVKAE